MRRNEKRGSVPAMNTPVLTSVSERIAEELRAILGRANKSRRALARDLDVDPMWVSRRLTGSQPFTVEDVVRICRALEVDPMPLLEHALTP